MKNDFPGWIKLKNNIESVITVRKVVIVYNLKMCKFL